MVIVLATSFRHFNVWRRESPGRDTFRYVGSPQGLRGLAGRVTDVIVLAPLWQCSAIGDAADIGYLDRIRAETVRAKQRAAESAKESR